MEKKRYIVTLRIVLTRSVDAYSKREAEEIARDMGECDCDLGRSSDWKAKIAH